jgi:hypothetical protein
MGMSFWMMAIAARQLHGPAVVVLVLSELLEVRTVEPCSLRAILLDISPSLEEM